MYIPPHFTCTLFIIVCIEGCWWLPGSHGTHVEVTGQLWGVSSLLFPSHGFSRSNSDHQAFGADAFTCRAIPRELSILGGVGQSCSLLKKFQVNIKVFRIKAKSPIPITKSDRISNHGQIPNSYH